MDANDTPAATQWRAVLGYEGLYTVSEFGEVRSERRFASHGAAGLRLRAAQVMRPYANHAGYLMIKLTRDGIAKNKRVSVLVAEAFIGPRPPGMLACHNDGSRSDNHYKNLRWDTPLGNQADRKIHGTERRGAGTTHGMAKLSVDQVIGIRADARCQRTIAAAYAISPAHVGRIKNRVSWASIPAAGAEAFR